MGVPFGRKGLLCLAAAAGLSAVPAPAGAQARGPLGGDVAVHAFGEAVAQDAREYARRYAIPVPEAVQRLRAQEETVAATDALQAEFGERLAGITLEHRPAFRVVVLLTGEARVATRFVSAGGLAVPVVFKTGAGVTRARSLKALRTHQAAIRVALEVPPGMGFDPRSGELVVVVHARDLERQGEAALDARFEKLTGVKVRIRRQGLEHRDAAAGGGRVEGAAPGGKGRLACTSGFVVTDGARTGIATAAHCPDLLEYVDANGRALPLSFLGQWGWSFQDVQIHLTGVAEQPVFHADPGKRSVRRLASWRTRASTRAGDAVCHRGETSGYSCSEVELTDYAPPGDLCGGPCAPVWTTVSGPFCQSGDSGGPVFSGAIAFGILKGASYSASGRCDFYYYMSTDYLPEGWTLLR